MSKIVIALGGNALGKIRVNSYLYLKMLLR